MTQIKPFVKRLGDDLFVKQQNNNLNSKNLNTQGKQPQLHQITDNKPAQSKISPSHTTNNSTKKYLHLLI